MFTIGNIYLIKGQLYRCIKLRQNGINTFQKVDQHGDPIIIRSSKSLGTITDHGIRLISQKNISL